MDGEAHGIQLSLLLGLLLQVQLSQSFVAQVLQLGVSMLKLGLHDFAILLLGAGHLELLL